MGNVKTLNLSFTFTFLNLAMIISWRRLLPAPIHLDSQRFNLGEDLTKKDINFPTNKFSLSKFDNCRGKVYIPIPKVQNDY